MKLFDEFWAIYPRKRGTSRKVAERAWNRLGEADKDAAVESLAWFAANDWRGIQTRFIPHGSTFLNQRRWETIEERTEALADELDDTPAAHAIDWRWPMILERAERDMKRKLDWREKAELAGRVYGGG